VFLFFIFRDLQALVAKLKSQAPVGPVSKKAKKPSTGIQQRISKFKIDQLDKLQKVQDQICAKATVKGFLSLTANE
jgi:hypothetical protein